ncbi:MAG: T9SS type A sorting domain-containing protein, partial [Bacteroidales bacterium]|nr:T9SS type A sorting domain-containing protein [Bacteroidales bacterium]
TPADDYQVKEWKVNTEVITDNTELTYTIENLDADATVTVEFETIPATTYAVTFSVVDENGTIAATVDGTAIESGDEVVEGSEEVFTATPADDYQVKEWKVNTEVITDNTELTYTIENLDADATVTVEFEAIPATTYAVTFSVVGTNGTIAATVDGVAIESGAEVEEGSDIVFTATPADEYEVKEWMLDGDIVVGNTSNELTISDLQGVSEVTVEFKVIVGIETSSLSNFTAYPNPFTNTMTIDNVGNASRVIFINLIGQQVKVVNLTDSNSAEISTDDLLSGVYLVTIVDNQGQKAVRKMIKR